MKRLLAGCQYLSVGQIYLDHNPLLKEPLKIEHVKPRLLGDWGTTVKAADPDPKFVVKGADEADFQTLVKVVDVLQQLGIAKVGMATQ